ncbi:MAG: nuclear protein SET [uncultured bacterium]|nr:MAG: nuclear protein SET [uncultured bacterium]
MSFSWLSENIRAKKTKKIGNGIFAINEIKKNDTVAIFGGYVMTAAEESKLPDLFKDQGLQISEDFVLTIRKKTEIEDGGYFNHSCDPNVGYRGQIFLVAMRDIKKGEEIVFDYAMVLHRSKGAPAYNIKCLCGSKKCRGVITDNDWKLPELQKKYDGFFQFYLQEKINKIKNK